VPDAIEFYFDFISPFAYLGSVVIERTAARHGREVVWRPLLVGVTIMKVMGLPPLPSIPLKGPYLRRDLKRLSEFFDVPLRHHGLPSVSSVVACRAFLAIAEADPQLAKRFGRMLFHRLWRDGRDITDIENVLHVAGEAGADLPTLRAILLGSEARDRLRRAVDDAVARGIFGVPTFIADGEVFWGNDHIWMLEHWLANGRFKDVPQ
jgi:2-hydroxychromene-2-carboxylate isomerase